MRIILCVVTWALFFCSGIGSCRVLELFEEETVSLQAQSLSLKDVVDLISKQTGYTIHVEKDLLTMPVTGRYNNVRLDTFFRRIFKGKNVALLISEKDKSCTVQMYGEKERLFYTVMYKKKDDSTEAEVAESQKEQLLAFYEFSQDPDSVDPLIGLTHGKIESSQQKQRKAFVAHSKNINTVDELTGLTVNNRALSQEAQRKIFLEYSEDIESVDSITGQKKVDVSRAQEAQRAAFLEFSNNPDSVDSLTGLTLGQIQESRRKQLGK